MFGNLLLGELLCHFSLSTRLILCRVFLHSVLATALQSSALTISHGRKPLL